ncbi:MAG: hypothetical protein U1F83_10395 [Verrucomicrobiota bacterium]
MDAEKKRKANEVQKKLRQGLLQAVAVLDSDVNTAREHWLKSPDSQFWRRMLLRCCCASVEGTLSLLKQVTPHCAEFFDVALTSLEMKILTERRTYVENGVEKTKPAFLPFRDNVKETFKAFAKAHTLSSNTDFNTKGFTELCNAFELRNRLMHPKTVFDLGVDDKALDEAERGLKWFKHSLVKMLEDCGGKLPFPTKQK